MDGGRARLWIGTWLSMLPRRMAATECALPARNPERTGLTRANRVGRRADVDALKSDPSGAGARVWRSRAAPEMRSGPALDAADVVCSTGLHCQTPARTTPPELTCFEERVRRRVGAACSGPGCNAQVCAPCVAAKGDIADLDGGITWDPNAIDDSAGEAWLSRLRKRAAAQLVAGGADTARSPWRPN